MLKKKVNKASIHPVTYKKGWLLRTDRQHATTSERRFVNADDRLGDLPDCLLHVILSYLGSQQAVQTCVLSRRWRHLWRDVPLVDIDDREFVNGQYSWERFEDFGDGLLMSIRPAAGLDVFRLHLASGGNDMATTDRWIRRGLRHLPAAVDIHAAAAHDRVIAWKPHSSILRPGSKPGLSACSAGHTRRLTTLRLVGVHMNLGFVENLGHLCPALEDFYAERCDMRLLSVSSPTLRRLTVIDTYRTATTPKMVAPRLAYLCLDLLYNGEELHDMLRVRRAAASELLPALTEASIRLLIPAAGEHRLPNQPAREQRKLDFFKSMPGFLALFPNIVKLQLQGFTTMALLENESQEFPVLSNLRSFLLENCDVGVNFQALTSILRNTSNLEKLALHLCMFVASPIVKRRNEMASSKSHGAAPVAPVVFWCKKLTVIEIKRRQQDDEHMDRVLSEISKGMLPAQWRQVKTSCTIVSEN